MSKRQQKFFFRHQRVKKASRDRNRKQSAFNKLKKNVQKNTKMLKNTVEGKQIYIETSHSLSDGFETTPTNLMDGLAQGVADTGTGSTVSTGARIGNSINVKSISARILLNGVRYSPSVANPNAKSGGTHRVIIYNSPCGESLVAQDILKETSSGMAGLRSPLNINVAQGKMYDIWYDETHVLSDARPEVLIQFYKKWKDGKQVLYDNNNTQPSNFRPRMIIVSDDVPPGATNYASYSFKTKYEDL